MNLVHAFARCKSPPDHWLVGDYYYGNTQIVQLLNRDCSSRINSNEFWINEVGDVLDKRSVAIEGYKHFIVSEWKACEPKKCSRGMDR